MRVSGVTRPLLLGVATGCRASLGLAGVSYGDRLRGEPRLVGAVQTRAGRVVTGALVLGELVGDKLPSAPSRLAMQALIPRLVLGATGGAALAWRDGRSRPAAALAGLAGAAVGSVAGLRYRQAAKQRGLPDLPVALAEDALALALARRAGRARR
ncbi:MAG: hypothetical protein H0V10_05050 [Geodermatophilaceae bacterium]|nr:hypothetical protein [Geodermatophilaceae bacterium]